MYQLVEEIEQLISEYEGDEQAEKIAEILDTYVDEDDILPNIQEVIDDYYTENNVGSDFVESVVDILGIYT